jgi:hypothetical protein
MSDNFLSRWSRRKQEARRVDHRPDRPDADEILHPGSEEAARGREAEVPGEPALSPEEIAALPDVEELTAETDISAFLRKGVPDALRNAALRRMWSLDPAIRDFVGEARDYAYDWNTPGGVPGSGELLPGQDVQAMVHQVFGEAEPERRELGQSEVEASRVRDRERLPIAELDNPPASQQACSESERDAVRSEEAGVKKSKADNILATADQARTAVASHQARPSLASDAAASPRHGGAKPV